MQRGSKATNGPKKHKRRVRFPGLCTDAEDLGVHRNHLYMVLAGLWQSRSLLKRYTALKGGRT